MNALRPPRRRLSILTALALGGLGATGLTVAQAAGGGAPRTASLAEETVTVAVAGDVCGSACNQTDDVITTMAPDALLVAGDLAYESGKLSEFRGTYDANWGKFNTIVKPVPGNHEYRTTGAAGYFDYFEENSVDVGERGKGYYSFDLGSWHIVGLNSNLSLASGSTQLTWLKNDLAASSQPCTLAYWHHARFSSGDHGDDTNLKPAWQALVDAKADVVVVGHDHHYERFAPALADGTKDTTHGVRQFVVGTGGRALYSATQTSAATSEKFQNNTFGVGQFELSPTGYTFAFKPVAGRTFTDSTSGTCKAKGSTNPGSTVTVTNPGSRTATVGTATSLQIQASSTSGGSLTYAATGLPAGLAINASTGLISGTPSAAGSFSTTVTATDSTGAKGSTSFGWTVTGGSTLANGVPVTGISGAQGSEQRWSFTAPAGATNIKVTISGGTGDADLYVDPGPDVATNDWECRPYSSGNNETCSLGSASGQYAVLLHGYRAYSGVTLTASWTAP